jgi:hypothetical protein
MKGGSLGKGEVRRCLRIGFVAHVHSLGQARRHDRCLEPRAQVCREVADCRTTEEFADTYGNRSEISHFPHLRRHHYSRIIAA